MGGYLLGLHGFPTHTIARKLDNPYLDRWINEFRGATGQFMIPKHGSSQRHRRELLDSRRHARAAGRPARRQGGLLGRLLRQARLHAQGGRPVHAQRPGAHGDRAPCCRTGGPLHFEMHVADLVDPADPGFDLGSVPLVAQWYTRRLEELIRPAPDQYWWLHHRWREPPPDGAARNPAAAAAAAKPRLVEATAGH